MKRHVLIVVLLVFGTTSPLQAQSAPTLFVGNQGLFGADNGSITAINPASGQRSNGFSGVESLIQDVAVHPDGVVIVTANTSDRVDAFSQSDGAFLWTTTGISMPRYVAFYQDRVLITSHAGTGGDGEVVVLALSDGQITGRIGVGAVPEGLAVVGDRAWVAHFNYGADSTISVIDLPSMTLQDTYDMGCNGPRFLAHGPQSDVWVVCMGRVQYNADYSEIIATYPASVSVRDADNPAVEIAAFPLETVAGGAALGQDVHASGGRLGILMADRVIMFDQADRSRLDDLLLPGADFAGAVLVDGKATWVTRFASFTSAGRVEALSTSGEVITAFEAGLIPAALALSGASAVARSEHTMDMRPTPKAYPNPTDAQWTLPTYADGEVVIYDMLGRVVLRTDDAVVDVAHLPTGTYVIRYPTGLTELGGIVR